jgi:hypothetical protein
MQRTARRWMLERERATRALPHPTWRAFVTRVGLPLWQCGATGEVSTCEPPRCQDVRGGFFCDEPVCVCHCEPRYDREDRPNDLRTGCATVNHFLAAEHPCVAKAALRRWMPVAPAAAIAPAAAWGIRLAEMQT